MILVSNYTVPLITNDIAPLIEFTCFMILKTNKR